MVKTPPENAFRHEEAAFLVVRPTKTASLPVYHSPMENTREKYHFFR
jgi:hypothetical protein